MQMQQAQNTDYLLSARGPIRVHFENFYTGRALSFDDHFDAAAAIVVGRADAIVVAVVGGALDTVASGPAGNGCRSIEFNFALSGRGVTGAGAWAVTEMTQGGGLGFDGDGGLDGVAVGGVALGGTDRVRLGWGRRFAAGGWIAVQVGWMILEPGIPSSGRRYER